MRWAWLLAGLGLLASAANASAQTANDPIQVIDAAGNPLLSAVPSPTGALGEVSWRICPPRGAPCVPAMADPASGVLRPGSQPAGTTFEATVNIAGQQVVQRSSPWLGRVARRMAPRLVGSAVVGHRVRVFAGTWTGGWGDEYDTLRLQACRTRAATRCRTLSAPLEGLGPPDAATTITSRYAGWYLIAVDRRLARDQSFTKVRRRPVPPVRPGTTVAFSAPKGPVGPSVSLRQRARYRHGRPELGTLRCPVRCNVQLSVATSRGTYKRKFTARGLSPVVARLPRARPGLWRVTVRIDGRRTAARRITVIS